MAQLSGVMTADFSDFHFEIDKSIVKLKDLEGASGHANSGMGEFSEGLGAVDKTLNVLGIRIGPQIQAIKELGSAAGRTATEIGYIGTAGLTVAAAVGGWQIGRMIADFVGLDDMIGNATASLLNLGDVAAQRAGAGMDVLNRAAQIAGRTVLDFDEAMQIIQKHNRDVAESFNTGAQRVADWNREIAAHRDVLPTIATELKNHTSSIDQVARHYGISREAIEFYIRTLNDSTKAQKAWADEARPKYEAIRRAQEEVNEATGNWHKTLLTIKPETVTAASNALALGVNQKTVADAYLLSEIQINALSRQMKLNVDTMAVMEPALGTLDDWIKTNAGDTKAWNTEWRFTSEVIDTEVLPSLDAVIAKAPAVAAALETAMAPAGGGSANARWGQGSSAPVAIDTGNITYGTMGFAAVFEEYMKKAGGGGGALGGFIGGGPPKDFLTWALSMGLASRGPAITNTFNLVDTQDGLARKVGDTISSQIQRGSLVN